MNPLSPVRFLVISGIIWLLVWLIGAHILVTTQLSLIKEFTYSNADILFENGTTSMLSLRATVDMYILGYLCGTAGAILSTGVSYVLFLWTKHLSQSPSK